MKWYEKKESFERRASEKEAHAHRRGRIESRHQRREEVLTFCERIIGPTEWIFSVGFAMHRHHEAYKIIGK